MRTCDTASECIYTAKIQECIGSCSQLLRLLAWPLILIGLFLTGSQTLIDIGIILFSTAVLFQLVTLPVEFNASKRAIQTLGEAGILHYEELAQSKKVLNAAALTYVAAAAATILQLLRLILLFGGRRRD